jgi:D-alanine-D-alanine ligase
LVTDLFCYERIIVRKKKQTIAILYHYLTKSQAKQYFSKEHAITDQQTDETVLLVSKIFKSRGYKVQHIRIIQKDLSNLKHLKADYVFNLVDSKSMELKIARILDRMKIPHSGSSFEAIQISNNKIRSKKLFEKSKLPTPKYTIIPQSQRLSRSLVPSKFPVILKPAFEHCSIGITEDSVVVTYEQFKNMIRRLRRKYNQTVLAEEYIPGKELQVTVLETPEETIALPIAQIVNRGKIMNKWGIYGFDEKWRKNLDVYKNCYFISPPSKLKLAIDAQIKRDAIRAFYALGLRDYARFDLRYNPKIKQWYFLEANANAGISESPEDAITASVKAYGLSVDDFVMRIVQNSIN